MTTKKKAAKKDANRMAACPFCGLSATMVPWHGGSRDKVLVGCENESCPVQPSVTGESPSEAVSYWNLRNGKVVEL